MSLPSPRSPRDPRVCRLRQQSRDSWLDATLGHAVDWSDSSSSAAAAARGAVQQEPQQGEEEEEEEEEESSGRGEGEEGRRGSEGLPPPAGSGRLSNIAEAAAAAAAAAAARAEAAEAAAEEAAVEASRAAAAARAAADAAEAESAAEEEAERLFARQLREKKEHMRDFGSPPALSSQGSIASPPVLAQEMQKIRQWSRDRWAEGVQVPAAQPQTKPPS